MELDLSGYAGRADALPDGLSVNDGDTSDEDDEGEEEGDEEDEGEQEEGGDEDDDEEEEEEEEQVKFLKYQLTNRCAM